MAQVQRGRVHHTYGSRTPWSPFVSLESQGGQGSVATAEQMQEWQALRGRFLTALWNSENAGQELVPVSDLIVTIGARDLPERQLEQLVRNLKEDGLITDPGFEPVKLGATRLTSEGRREVDRWLAKPDQPTEVIQVPANEIHINNMHVTWPTLLGSTANNINTTYDTSGKELLELVAQFRQLLTTVELSPDDQEELEADLDVLEEEAGSPQPKPQRVRPILRRLKDALIKGTVAGAEVAAKQETIHLIEQAQKANSG
jgi:hypothetical protein